MGKGLTKFVLLALFLALVGCAKAVHKDWAAIGGSRADATIKMGYSWDPRSEKPETSRQQAVDLASTKCKTWGYDGAEEFGASVSTCLSHTMQPFVGVVCEQMLATAEFQCIGGVPATQPEPRMSRTTK